MAPVTKRESVKRNTRVLVIEEPSKSTQAYLAARVLGEDVPSGLQYFFRQHWQFDGSHF